MNMFLHELKAYRKSTIIWAVSLAALAVMYISIYPSFSKDVESFRKIIEAYPEAARKAIGLSIDSFTTLLGFYSFVFGIITLFGAIQAMNYGTSIVSKEIRDKTADFLLTKPVSRKQILTAKLLGVVTSLVITNIIYLIIAVIMARVTNPGGYSLKIFLMISFTMFFVQMMFMTLGVIVSVILPKIKSVIAVSLSTVFSFYIISMFGSVLGENAIRYITPFKYYDAAYIVKNGTYEASFIIIEFLFIAVAIFASYWVYIKKDIHAV